MYFSHCYSIMICYSQGKASSIICHYEETMIFGFRRDHHLGSVLSVEVREFSICWSESNFIAGFS